MLDTNLTSAFVASQAAYPHMKRAGGGKIVNIGSMMSIFGASFAAPYAASKGGIVQLTRRSPPPGRKDNIQVNAVLPGWIDTALTQRARKESAACTSACSRARPPAAGARPTTSPASRCSSAAPASDFVTGTAIPVDGGYASLG